MCGVLQRGGCLGLSVRGVNQSIKGPHKATHGPRKSHIPAPPQYTTGGANPASQSEAG